MLTTFDNWVDKTDKAGDELIENILKPIAKGSVDFLVTDNKMAQFFLSVKTAFIENINKVVDLDDELQIYIMAVLVKAYKEKGSLNYFEKSLYYNINQISKDDFSIYYCFYTKFIIANEKRKSFYIEYSIENKDIVEIVFKKFISYGIIKDDTSVNNDRNSTISFRFSLSSYSSILYDSINYFFRDRNIDDLCKVYLPIDLNRGKSRQVKIVGF